MEKWTEKIQLYQNIVETTQIHGPISKLIGMKFVHVEKGKTKFELTPNENHYNRGGSVQGGVLCTMADASMGFAFGSTVDIDQEFTTIEMKINFIRPVFINQTLLAIGKVVHRGKRTGVGESTIYFKKEFELTGDAAKPVAKASCSLIIL
ncbi:hypothetical protein NEF87_001321 [Candidatus Lokiarchaeum ossiferum]|uniref:Thioesterase domain-containing protein n=1 Tax=Candidatus Lokiarchaeum ossiferum TaxID=2951803 RepID=A0ABY6HNN6_9ARCH|nr:hypothetical protein NEF87_001321 [Candidatus Lokiarchaeum sp. B-35]